MHRLRILTSSRSITRHFLLGSTRPASTTSIRLQQTKPEAAAFDPKARRQALEETKAADETLSSPKEPEVT